MFQLLSKAFTKVGRTQRLPIASLKPKMPALQSLFTKINYNFGHFGDSKQKIIVKYDDELRPFTINNLWPNHGARRRAKKLGRGKGSGKGKTSGRGMKGQRSRSGASIPARFEGGQTPLSDRLPKWGMHRSNVERPVYINVGKIIYLIKHGRLDAQKTITIKDLRDAGAFPRCKFGVKVLARGMDKLNFALNLEVTDASESVIKTIKENGGSVTCVYRTKLKMKEHLKPHLFKFPLEDPLPPKRAVDQMDRIKARGAEVVYNVPEWKQALNEESKKAEAELKKDDFEYPVKRHEGMGKDKVRVRKQPLQKQINYGLD